MPGPLPTPVASDVHLPPHCDLLILGVVIMGSCIAHALAERNHKVFVCKKCTFGAEQSSRNLGWVRFTNRKPIELDLMFESLRQWQTLDKRLARLTGYKQCGIVFSEKDEQAMAMRRAWLEHLGPFGLKAQVLSPTRIVDYFPGARYPAVGGIYSPFDGRAEPQLATSAIAESARDKGATLLNHCAVQSIDTAGGRVCGVHTERGYIASSTVVIAGGVWSNLLCRQVGIDYPQLDVKVGAINTTPVSGPDVSFGSSQFALRRRADGGYTVGNYFARADIVPNSFRYATRFAASVRQPDLSLRLGKRFFEELFRRTVKPGRSGPFERQRTLDPELWFDTQAMFNRISEMFPFLATAQIKERWAAHIDVTPDSLPVIDELTAVPGLFMCSGFSGHGFGIAPGAGTLMADLVTGAKPIVDPAAFSLKRFFKN